MHTYTNAPCVCVCVCEGVVCRKLKEAPAKGNSAQRFCSNKLIVLCAAHKQESSVSEGERREAKEREKGRERETERKAERAS